MVRSLLVILTTLLAAAAVGSAAYLTARRACASSAMHSSDDLEWLRREFHLNGTEFERIRKLHEGYLPKCHEMCARIAAKKQELEAALEAGKGVTAEAEAKLAEVAALRARCQTQMLRHFYEVSQNMPAEEGRRYLSEMQRLTLGFHEQIENHMAGGMPSADGHH